MGGRRRWWGGGGERVECGGGVGGVGILLYLAVLYTFNIDVVFLEVYVFLYSVAIAMFNCLSPFSLSVLSLVPLLRSGRSFPAPSRSL